MRRGRPTKSQIRQNVVEILFHLGKGYGYQISKIYNEVFPRATQRVIYYHLKKGVFTKEISIQKIQQEHGDFSWGSVVEKKYYTLGSKAVAKGDSRIQDFLKTGKK